MGKKTLKEMRIRLADMYFGASGCRVSMSAGVVSGAAALGRRGLTGSSSRISRRRGTRSCRPKRSAGRWLPNTRRCTRAEQVQMLT